MSVVQPGGGKPGEKPGSGQRTGQGQGQGQRPGQRPNTARRPAQKPGSGRPVQGKGGGRGPAGRPPAGRRPGGPAPAGPPRRFSPTAIAFGVIGLVVVIVVALVVIKVTGGSSNNASQDVAPQRTAIEAPVLTALTSVPETVEATVGVPSGLNKPTIFTGQPALTLDGKPGAIFIGGEFCPYCAAERWAIAIAFSKFGTFSGLKETESSPWDTFPDTATLSFYQSTYTSNYVTLQAVENIGNDTTGLGTRKQLAPLDNQQQTLWTKYENMAGNQAGSVPFLDIGNKVFVLSPTYNPQILQGLNQSAIAAKLSNPQDPVTQAIVGTANYLMAAICNVTGGQPGDVCSASSTQTAAKALGLS
jgi:hypothetical protein